MKTRRRPSRSPDLPPSSSNPPKASAYALTTHSRLVPEKPSAVWMCGRATLTMVASSTTMSCAVAMTASARPSRRVGAPEPGVAVAFDAAALLTTRVGCPVSGDVADKTISLIEGALNHRRDRRGSYEGHAPYVLNAFFGPNEPATCPRNVSSFPV